MMGKFGEGLKKVLLAGVGGAAITAEKSKEFIDEMAKKGEKTVERGKALNQELKYNLKKTVKENVNVSVKTSTPEELDEFLEKMTPEQLAQLKERIQSIEEDDIIEECPEETPEVLQKTEEESGEVNE